MVSSRRAVQGVIASGLLLGTALTCLAQSGAPVQEQPRDVAPGRVEQSGSPVQQQPKDGGPRTLEGDRTIQQQEQAERDRALAQDRAAGRPVVQERVVERRREGEVYVSGFGGFTWGHNFSGVEGQGTVGGQQFGGLDLKDSGVYGAKVGYFHPGRLNWLGLEVEGFNTNPHIEQGGGIPGTHLRVTTLAFNVIARTKVGCRNRDDARRRDDGRVATDGTVRGSDDRTELSPLEDNARCPLQLYAGVGPGIFFAETSNQFGRSTDNGRVGVNALAGAKFFLTRNFALYAEYKFNYAHFDFSQALGTNAGFAGDYKASHVVGGLAWHF